MSNLDYQERPEGDEIFSIPVKAGKRIYYFDVKSTRGNDYYITLTESRKRQMRDGSFVIDKHKIHLYKEDFEKFAEGLAQAIDFIKANRPEISTPEQTETAENSSLDSFTRNIPTEEDFFAGL